MNSRSFQILAPLILPAMMISCAQNQPLREPTEITDSAVLIDFRNELNNHPELRVSSLEADAQSGVLTLSGFAAGETDKENVLRIGRATKGVREVIDNLVVRPMSP